MAPATLLESQHLGESARDGVADLQTDSWGACHFLHGSYENEETGSVWLHQPPVCNLMFNRYARFINKKNEAYGFTWTTSSALAGSLAGLR